MTLTSNTGNYSKRTSLMALNGFPISLKGQNEKIIIFTEFRIVIRKKQIYFVRLYEDMRVDERSLAELPAVY